MTDLTKPSDAPTPRREFIGQIAASAIVLAGAACASPGASASAAGAPTPTRTPSASAWDDSWVGRLTAKHKAVFDSPDVDENATPGFSQATRYVNGMRDALGVALTDVQTVVVVRHTSIPFAFNDAMWAKYGLGEMTKVKQGEAWATRNPMQSSRNPAAANNDRPQSTIEWMTSHGSFVLACDLATQRLAGQIAQRAGSTMRAVYDELKANVAPGVILQPNGVYAVHRAQEAGCTYIRST